MNADHGFLFRNFQTQRYPTSNAQGPLARYSTASYFHGGYPGLRIDGRILSRAALPKWDGIDVTWGGRPVNDVRPWAHLSTDLQVAIGYAGSCLLPSGEHVPGDVYQVELIGTPEPDPDWPRTPTGTFMRARAARIVAIVRTGVS